MANEEHLLLAQYLKNVHLNLRKSAITKGSEEAWKEHCERKDILQTYASTMEKLATSHWDTNCNDDLREAISRIEWATNFINEYFTNEKWREFDIKEVIIGNKIDLEVKATEKFLRPIKLLDVGSCYNPFKQYDYMEVLGIDLCPANSSVLECDFLSVTTGNDIIKDNIKVQQLPESYFDVVTFCFLLEYIPSSAQRIQACEKAYLLLKPGGLLIISTPDSKHVGANSKLMKCWRYSLALIGFNRIKYEKFKHMHCMAFRKSLHKDIASRWSMLHKEPYMSFSINIPQDFQKHDSKDEFSSCQDVITSVDDFKEMPYYDHEN